MKAFGFSHRYFILFLVLFGIELLIGIFVHDQFIRPYVGDILVMFLMYSFIKSIYKNPTKRLPYYLFGFAVVVELLQLINVVKLLGLQDNRIARVILGSVFDFKDIFCYFLGMLLLLGFEQALRKDISYL